MVFVDAYNKDNHAEQFANKFDTVIKLGQLNDTNRQDKIQKFVEDSVAKHIVKSNNLTNDMVLEDRDLADLDNGLEM